MTDSARKMIKKEGDSMLDPVIMALPTEEKLTGLAEECAELAQAALKLRRVLTGISLTPVSEEDAIEKLYEEVADVQLYIQSLALCKEDIDRRKAEKEARWACRLKALSANEIDKNRDEKAKV